MDPNNPPTGLSASGQNSLDDYPVALAALVLAAGAFVVALAQALMQYFSSSEARGKCTYEAIDMSAKSTKMGWNWTFWKLRVYYPVLNISFTTVMRAAVEQADYHIDASSSPINKLASFKEGDRKGWGFTVLEETETDTSFLAVSDGYTTLVDEDSDPITSKELTWTETASLVWWKLTHNAQPVNRPRASWAQMLMAFGIRDTKSLVYKHADADIIPGSVDAPIQRVKLFDLGMLALYLGFKKVTINTREREFEAVGDFGTLSTLKHNELGKVIHFEGDILAIFAQISKGSINAYDDLVVGQFSFAPGISMNGMICPLHLLVQVTTKRWDCDRFLAAQRAYLREVQTEEGLAKGQVAAEASLFDMYYKNPNLQSLGDPDESATNSSNAVPQHVLFVDPDDGFRPKMIKKATTGLSARHLSALIQDDNDEVNYHDLCLAIKHWSSATGLKMPTIIPAASLCLLTGCETGFPSSVLVEPVMPWVLALADQVKRSSEQFTWVSGPMTTLFKTNTLLFVRSRDAFWYSFNYIGMAGGVWQWGWILQETKEIYDCLNPEDQDDLILRGPDGEYTGDVKPVILTECYALIQQFNPREWAAKIERIVTMQLLKFRPHNMVWTQILLLDVAIHFLVRGGFYDEHREGYDFWTKEVVAVFNAIVNVWDPSAEGQSLAEDDEESTRSTKLPIPPPPKATSDHFDLFKEHDTPLIETLKVLEPTVTDATAWTPTDVEDQGSSEPARESSPSRPRSEAPKLEKPPPPPGRKNSSRWEVEWDLAGSLRNQPKLFDDVGAVEREAKVQKLASLLQLRALFVIALFLLMPDSSDVYLANGERVKMPMI